MRKVSLIITIVALFACIIMCIFARNYIQQYELVMTGQTFLAALIFLLLAAISFGIAISYAIIYLCIDHKGG